MCHLALLGLKGLYNRHSATKTCANFLKSSWQWPVNQWQKNCIIIIQNPIFYCKRSSNLNCAAPQWPLFLFNFYCNTWYLLINTCLKLISIFWQKKKVTTLEMTMFLWPWGDNVERFHCLVQCKIINFCLAYFKVHARLFICRFCNLCT